MELTAKQLREQREFETLFKNPKYARSMWAKNVIDRYTKPAIEPILLTDKDGNTLPQSQIELAIWRQLEREISATGQERLPTEGEMMEACQAYYSRHNANSYIARRDSMGAKPIDESKQSHTVNNPLEQLSDEELELIQKTLEARKQKEIENDSEKPNNELE